MSIRRRILISYLVIIGVGFLYLVYKLADPEEIKPRYMESVEEPMVDTAHLLASLLEQEIRDGQLDVDRLRDVFKRASTRKLIAQIYSKTKTELDLHVYVTDAKGVVVFDSRDGRAEGQDYSQWRDVFLTLRGGYGARATKEDPSDPTSVVLYVAAPIRNGDAIAGVLTVSKPQQSMAAFMEESRRQIIYRCVIAGLVVVVVGSVFATWLTHPIQLLTSYAKAVRDGRRVALPGLGTSEIATLGRTIEEMRDALEGRKYVENYVQALTHEIKSPVAAIRGAAELLREPMPGERRDKFLANIETETVRLQEIVDRLLLLSAVEAKKTLDERKPVELEATLRKAVESIRSQAAAKGIDLRLSVANENCWIEGDAFLLEKAVVNLLQNAVAFTPQSGAIVAGLHCLDSACTISVRDTGPGVPDYALPRVFERFFSLPRPDTGKKSSGLGLAFVREVATLHRGAVTLENAPEGGAVAILVLPGSTNAGR